MINIIYESDRENNVICAKDMKIGDTGIIVKWGLNGNYKNILVLRTNTNIISLSNINLSWYTDLGEDCIVRLVDIDIIIKEKSC